MRIAMCHMKKGPISCCISVRVHFDRFYALSLINSPVDRHWGWYREVVGRVGRVFAVCEALRADVHGSEYYDAAVEGQLDRIFQGGRESEQGTREDLMGCTSIRVSWRVSRT